MTIMYGWLHTFGKKWAVMGNLTIITIYKHFKSLTPTAVIPIAIGSPAFSSSEPIELIGRLRKTRLIENTNSIYNKFKNGIK